MIAQCPSVITKTLQEETRIESVSRRSSMSIAILSFSICF